MKYTHEQLADYVLGLLEPQEMQEVEQHLEHSREAQQEVDALKASLFQLADELPPLAPAADSWERIQARLESRVAPVSQQMDTPAAPAVPETQVAPASVAAPAPLRMPNYTAWAAVLAVVMVGGWFGTQSYLKGAQARQEAQLIQQWTQNAQAKPLKTAANVQVASVVIHQDGQGMIIMNEKAQPDKSYQAWGIKDGKPVSLGVITSRTIQVDTTGLEAVAVSLEPEGGSATPTEVLGAVPVT